jgi:hypothetical protein
MKNIIPQLVNYDIESMGIWIHKSDLTKYSFMNSDDYNQFKYKDEEEQKIILQDLFVLLNYGKDLIAQVLVKCSIADRTSECYSEGAVIIDIYRFGELGENGRALPTFLVQQKTDNEIREITMWVDLKNKTSALYSNGYHSHGKSRYHYLENESLSLLSKITENQLKSRTLNNLGNLLEIAVENENFELATMIREELNARIKS